MPLFRRESEEERQRRTAEAAAAEASLRSLESGGLPLNAQRRLQEMREGGKNFFTSDLSVDEFLLSRHAGLRPISQVMGSSISRVARPVGLSWGGTGEIAQLSQGINDTRSRALSRLLEEASLLGAHAVVGVRINQREFEWTSELIEFTAVGTAVRLQEEIEGSQPALTDLSGQEFWKLYSAGFWPVAICASTSVYHVYSSGWGSVNLMFGGFQNQELTDFSAGSYAARELAMRRIYAQAQAAGASGLVGVRIAQHHRVLQETDNTNVPIRMLFTFTAMGTAVSALPESAGVPRPRPVLELDQ